MPPYHVVTVEKIPTTTGRKVCVEGVTVVYRRKQQDGDWHITVTDRQGRKLVLEMIPELPLSVPPMRRMITACGILGFDKVHQWYELHPLTSWKP